MLRELDGRVLDGLDEHTVFRVVQQATHSPASTTLEFTIEHVTLMNVFIRVS